MLLEGFQRCTAGLDVRVHLIRKLQYEALYFGEAPDVLPIVYRHNLFVLDTDVLGRGHMLSPFVDRVAILGRTQDCNFPQLWFYRNLREEGITQTAAMNEYALSIGGHPLHIEHDGS